LDTADNSVAAKIKSLLNNQNFIFSLALILALTVGQGADWLEPLLLPVLGLAMALSTLDISNRDLTSMKTAPGPILISLLLNFVVLGGTLLLMSRWLINDEEIRAGFVILAAIPPAINVIPYTYILKGNMVFSLIGTTGLYIVALGLTPALMILLLGANYLDPWKLLIILAELIVAPLVVSRIIIATKLDRRMTGWRKTAVKGCFFTTIYIIIGVNREVVFGQRDILIRALIIWIVATPVLGHVFHFIAGKFGKDGPTRISWMVMSTRKNAGLASGIAIALIGDRVAFPAGIHVVVDVLTLLWWGFYLGRKAR
jgi:BASS family bile acid:Na+ symporter